MFLHTKRLILRNFVESDIDAFVAYRNEPEVAKFQSWSIPYSREQAQKYIASIKDMNAPKQGDWLQIAIELKEANELIGDVGCFIKPEDARQATIGFTLASRHWGKDMPPRRFAAGWDIYSMILISTASLLIATRKMLPPFVCWRSLVFAGKLILSRVIPLTVFI